MPSYVMSWIITVAAPTIEDADSAAQNFVGEAENYVGSLASGGANDLGIHNTIIHDLGGGAVRVLDDTIPQPPY